MGMFDKLKELMKKGDDTINEYKQRDIDTMAKLISESPGSNRDYATAKKVQEAYQPLKDSAQDLASQTSGIINAGNYGKIMARLKPDMSREQMLKVIAEEQPKLNDYSAFDNVRDLNETTTNLVKDSGVAKDAVDLSRQYLGKDVNVSKVTNNPDYYGLYRPDTRVVKLAKDAPVTTGFHEGSHLYDDILGNMDKASNSYMDDVLRSPEKYSKNISSEADRIKSIANRTKNFDEEKINKLYRNLDTRMKTKDPSTLAKDADALIGGHFIDVPTEYNLLRNLLEGKPVIYKEPTEVASEFVKNKGKVSKETVESLRKFLQEKFNLNK